MVGDAPAPFLCMCDESVGLQVRGQPLAVCSLLGAGFLLFLLLQASCPSNFQASSVTSFGSHAGVRVTLLHPDHLYASRGGTQLSGLVGLGFFRDFLFCRGCLVW